MLPRDEIPGKRSADSQAYPAQPTLVHYPDPVLRRKAGPVVVFDAALERFCQAMYACMDEERGIGLAAPQVGVSRRIFVTDHGKRQAEPVSDRRVWINPRLSACEGDVINEEGCLSFPGIYAKVSRHARFIIHWQDVKGAPHQLPLDVDGGEFLGVIVQHELDHLDGTVFLDHLSPAQLGLIRRRLKDMERDYHEATGKTGSVLRR